MKYNKVRSAHDASNESIITEEVYKLYQEEFVVLVEDCNPATGKKKVPVKKLKKTN